MKNIYLFLLFCAVAVMAKAEDLPAFPGAEGFGRYVTGGRGGAVYHVTSLEDDGSEGTFRWAVNQSGTRTIVFDVSGTIFLESALGISNGNVTIAGQSAPGDGICVAGYPFTISANNVIIRFLRFRLGNENVAYHEGDGLGGMDRSNIIVDHCSISWSIDECCSVYGNENATVQWCIISQSLRESGHSKGAHGYGGNWGGSGTTYHHNLLCHHESRTPRLGPRYTTQSDERLDLRNNVIYNWAGNGCYGGEAMNVNIYNNYYKPGPATTKKGGSVAYRIAAIGVRTNSYIATYPDYAPTLHQWGKFYVEGNVMDGNAEVTADNWTKGIYAQISSSDNDGTFTSVTKDTMKLDAPIDFYAVTTHTAEVAYEKVLDYAGACLSRDILDSIMVADTRTGTATFSGTSTSYPGIIDSQEDCVYDTYYSGWPELVSTTPPTDSDGDGMPDSFERAWDLDPYDASDRNTIDEGSGYTMLEVYLNSLVSSIMTACTSDGELLGTIKDSATEMEEATEVTFSTKTYIGTGETSTEWEFSNGYSISNASSKDYASGTGNNIKYSRNVDFTINIPDGKAVTAFTIEGYTNVDSGDLAYVQKLNGEECSSDCTFPLRTEGETATYTYPFDTPVTGTLPFRITGRQIGAIITLTLESSSSGTREISSPVKDLRRLVDVYTLTGVQIRKQIPYIEVTASLSRGLYLIDGEKVIIP